MKKSNKISFDPATRKINLDGSNCLKVLGECQAMCCRGVFNIDISEEEFTSGKYKSHPFCLLTGKVCESSKINCANRKYRLEKNEDGCCTYLDEKNMCSIHDESPAACKEFICTGGWRIDFDFAASDQKLKMSREKLKDEMIFVLNPLVKLKTLFYSKDKKEIVFVKNLINKCGIVKDKSSFDNPLIDDEELIYAVRLFDGKNTLKDIRAATNKKYNLKLSEEEFDAIVWMLDYQKIIIFKNPDWSGEFQG